MNLNEFKWHNLFFLKKKNIKYELNMMKCQALYVYYFFIMNIWHVCSVVSERAAARGVHSWRTSSEALQCPGDSRVHKKDILKRKKQYIFCSFFLFWFFFHRLFWSFFDFRCVLSVHLKGVPFEWLGMDRASAAKASVMRVPWEWLRGGLSLTQTASDPRRTHIFSSYSYSYNILLILMFPLSLSYTNSSTVEFVHVQAWLSEVQGSGLGSRGVRRQWDLHCLL